MPVSNGLPAAGNWQVSLSGAILKQIPYPMQIAVTPAIYKTDSVSSFNLRRHFHNVSIGQIFAHFDGNPQRLFASLPSNVILHMEHADRNPLGFGWHRHSCEQIASSSTPEENLTRSYPIRIDSMEIEPPSIPSMG